MRHLRKHVKLIKELEGLRQKDSGLHDDVVEDLGILKDWGYRAWADPTSPLVIAQLPDVDPSIKYLKDGQARVYFDLFGDEFALLHFYRKKKQKLPRNVIKRVLNRYDDWLDPCRREDLFQ